MVLQVAWVFVVFIEVLNQALLTRPHKDLVLRVSEMVGETTPEVARTEDKNFFGGK